MGMDLPAILVVDDDLSLLRIYERWLRSDAYDVAAAASITAARAVSHRLGGRLRLLIADQNVNDGKGTDLAHELLEHHPDLEVVILSGDTGDIKEFTALQKPFLKEDLRRALESKLIIVG